MNMMNWEKLFEVSPFSRNRNTLLKTLEMELENFSGHVHKVLTESGLDLTQKNSPKSVHSTSTKHTSEPSTITIQTVTIQGPLAETYSNTTTETSSQDAEVNGPSKQNASTSSQPLTSRTRRARKATAPASS